MSSDPSKESADPTATSERLAAELDALLRQRSQYRLALDTATDPRTSVRLERTLERLEDEIAGLHEALAAIHAEVAAAAETPGTDDDEQPAPPEPAPAQAPGVGPVHAPDWDDEPQTRVYDASQHGFGDELQPGLAELSGFDPAVPLATLSGDAAELPTMAEDPATDEDFEALDRTRFQPRLAPRASEADSLTSIGRVPLAPEEDDSDSRVHVGEHAPSTGPAAASHPGVQPAGGTPPAVAGADPTQAQPAHPSAPATGGQVSLRTDEPSSSEARSAAAAPSPLESPASPAAAPPMQQAGPSAAHPVVGHSAGPSAAYPRVGPVVAAAGPSAAHPVVGPSGGPSAAHPVVGPGGGPSAAHPVVGPGGFSAPPSGRAAGPASSPFGPPVAPVGAAPGGSGGSASPFGPPQPLAGSGALGNRGPGGAGSPFGQSQAGLDYVNSEPIVETTEWSGGSKALLALTVLAFLSLAAWVFYQ